MMSPTPTVHQRIMSMRAMALRIRRYHTIPVLHQETVGEHSHRVCTLYLQLFGSPRAEVLEYILYHDMGELSSGDLPFNAKRDAPGIKDYMDKAEEAGLRRMNIDMPDLYDVEYARFKLCDMLQMLEFARIEMSMGNQYARSVQDNILTALESYKLLPSHQVKSGILVVMCGTPIQKAEEDD